LHQDDKKAPAHDVKRNSTEIKRGLSFSLPTRGLKLFALLNAWTGGHVARLHLTLQTEAALGSRLDLTPAAFATGIGIYFALPYEPVFPLVLATFVAMLVLFHRMVGAGLSYLCVGALMFALAGMVSSQLAVKLTNTNILERQWTGILQGTVIAVDQNRRGNPRYTIKVSGMDAKMLAHTPQLVRVSSASKSVALKPGEGIKGRARLQPMSGPITIGGYDFSFHSWFSGLGGVGFLMGAPEKIEATATLKWSEHLQVGAASMRLAIENRLIESAPGLPGQVAAALVTGNKTRIPDDVEETLRHTGLAHVLAISGLHMALVTLTLMGALRYLAATQTGLAIRYPIRKWSAALAFSAASFYLLISGAGIATQRAWLMISIMLLAIFLDRKAITMRSVAIAALVVLFISPESLFSPGFQMSFAAVASLVAVYRLLQKRRELRSHNDSFFQPLSNFWLGRIAIKTGEYFAGLAITSLVAGAATAVISAWHFHQVATVGLAANLAVMPIFGSMVMPFLLLAVLLMPYGLEFIPLAVAGFGIELMVVMADWFEARVSPTITGQSGSLVLLFAGCALTAFTVLKTRLRWIGLLPAAMAVMAHTPLEIPMLLVAEDGRSIAIQNQDGDLAPLFPRRSKFTRDIWRKAYGLADTETIGEQISDCGKDICRFRLRDGTNVTLLYDPDLIRQACNTSDILLAPRLWWVRCLGDKKPSVLLKRHDFEQYGSQAFYSVEGSKNKGVETAGKYRVETALPDPTRPWHRVVAPKE